MIRSWRKKIQNFFRISRLFPEPGKRRTSIKNTAGQVGVVLILVAALALIIYAAVMNMGRVSRTKTLTIMAANTSAGHMASLISSYGEKIFQETMGGSQRICGMTGVLKAIFTIIIVVIAIIITIASKGTGAPLALKLVALGIALTLSVASLVIQLTVVQPGLTSLWNKMMSEALTLEDTVIERGIMMGLQNSVTDQVVFPDLYDFDQDLNWETNPGVPREEAMDYVSRFAYYYTERLRKIIAPPIEAIQFFQEALSCFVYADPNKCDIDCSTPGMNVALCNDLNARFSNWGALDPVDCVTSFGVHACCPGNFPRVPVDYPLDFPSECNPCCVSDQAIDINGDVIVDGKDEPYKVRPDCCTDPSDPYYPCGNAALCDQNTPFREGPTVYGDIYDPAYEDHTNGFYSLRELLGRDDEHHLYMTNPWDAAYFDVAEPDRMRQIEQQNTEGAPEEGFFLLHDMSGYTKAPNTVLDYDLRPGISQANPPYGGIFPFLYRTKLWGTQLDQLDYNFEQCVYCDPGGGAVCDPGFTPYREASFYYSVDWNEAITGGLPAHAGTWCLDNANMGAPNDPPQMADNVTFPIGLFAETDTCAADPLGDGGWKRGADRFCSNVYPYEGNCPKHTACVDDATFTDHTDPYFDDRRIKYPFLNNVPFECDCGDGGSDPADFREDSLDEIVYGLSEFYSFVKTILEQDIRSLVRTTTSWYKVGAAWFEAPCVNVATGERLNVPVGEVGGACPFSYIKGDEGTLWVWRYELYRFWWRIFDWIYAQPPPNDLSPPYGMGVNEGLPHPGFYPAVLETKALDGLPHPYVATGCNNTSSVDAWCVPPEQAGLNAYGLNECPWITPDEAATFNYVPAAGDWIFDSIPGFAAVDPEMFNRSVTDEFGNPSRGDLFDVVSCLNWQINHERTYIDGDTAEGNAQKFYKCHDAVNITPDLALAADACSMLPRCMVPGADDILHSAVIGPAPASWTEFDIINCLSTSTVEDCVRHCSWLDEPGYPTGYTFVDPTIDILPNPADYGSCSWLVGGDPTFFNAVTAAVVMTTFPFELGSCGSQPGAPGPATPVSIAFRDAIADARDATDPVANPVYGDAAAHAAYTACHDSDFADCRTDCSPINIPQIYWDASGTIHTIPIIRWPADPAHFPLFEACANVLPPDPMAVPARTDAMAMADCTAACSMDVGGPLNFAYWGGWPYNLPTWDQPGEDNDVTDYASCSFLLPSPPPVVPGWSPEGDLFVDSLALLRGVVGDVDVSPAFRQAALDCWRHAEVQVSKFEARFTFLRFRLIEGLRAMLIFHDAWNHFTAFLDGNSPFNTASPDPFAQDSPMETMVQARFTFEETKGTESVVVYVWQDEDLKEDELRVDGSNEGFWHAVKVEVRAPGRCNNACGFWPVDNGPDSVGGVDPGWPRVDTYTKDWGTSRCYELVATEGMVKVRVIRFDESEGATGVIKFPDDQDLWEIRDYHPAADELTTAEVAGVEGACRALQLRANNGQVINGAEWGYAFMLNYSKYSVVNGLITDDQWITMDPGFTKGQYVACWDYVHDNLLSHGVLEESCAAYFFDRGVPEVDGGLEDQTFWGFTVYKNRGMRLKFVPCDGTFLAGGN